jgi:hypothetical protein
MLITLRFAWPVFWVQHFDAISNPILGSSVGRPQHAAEHSAVFVADADAIGSAERGANSGAV